MVIYKPLPDINSTAFSIVALCFMASAAVSNKKKVILSCLTDLFFPSLEGLQNIATTVNMVLLIRFGKVSLFH